MSSSLFLRSTRPVASIIATRTIQQQKQAAAVSSFTSTVVKRYNATYYGNKGKILASLPYFQSIDPEESPIKYLQNWQDISIVKHEGRAFDADLELLDKNKTFYFPRLKATSLSGHEVLVPETYSTKPIKLIAFALNTYGENATKTWLEPFVQQYGLNHPQIHIVEICFLEWKWLSIFTNSIVSAMKSSKEKLIRKAKKKSNTSGSGSNEAAGAADEASLLAHAYDNILISVGTIMDFAKAARLPNKYTGYVCLVDAENKVRWRGCGRMMVGGGSRSSVDSTTDTDTTTAPAADVDVEGDSSNPSVGVTGRPIGPYNRYNEFEVLVRCTNELLKEVKTGSAATPTVVGAGGSSKGRSRR